MTSETVPRTSFFDDDNLSNIFQFQKAEMRHQKDLNSTSTISNILYRPAALGAPLQQGFYVLHNRLLCYYKGNLSGQPDGVLDLSHSRLHPLPPSLTTSYYGFTLTRNGSKHEFYSPDEKTINNWINALKSVCVLTNFHDEYKALKMIGKGSFAKVYLVESKTTGKTYAVKAFTKESVIVANKANAKPSMLNEIDIMRVLDHDNVIKLYEVYETEKSIYLVLELIQGKSLQEILKKGGFKDNESRVITIISSILEALAYLSSKGVMHRDLKPDNILVDKYDKIKIVDFGLATFIDVPEYIFKKCGTPGYIAPEVFKYDPKNPGTSYDGHCDVFSTGCIIKIPLNCIRLFGAAFFDGPNASEILKINRRFTIEFQALNNAKQELKNPTSKFSREALDLLLQLLEFDQKLRPSASQALMHPFLFATIHQRAVGSYDFYPSGGSSPLVFDKRGSFAQEQYLSQLKSGANLTSPIRYTEKDSLYLDIGKPEITGKIDTLTSGSANNSVLIMSRGTSNVETSPVSPFGKAAGQKSFRGYGDTTNTQGLSKPSIYRNIAQGNEVKEPYEGGLFRLEEVKTEKRFSDYIPAREEYYQGGLNNYYSHNTNNVESMLHQSTQMQPSDLKYDVPPKDMFRLEDPPKRVSMIGQGQKLYDKNI